jgi:peptidoglycan/LPS O-acetylase OafA/YrhL
MPPQSKVRSAITGGWGMYLPSTGVAASDVAAGTNTQCITAIGRNVEAFSTPKYRADIDGLRAVAILSVVGYHAFRSWMPGGFVGVDVFFVISGYLISTIIFENLESQKFSFTAFYARRIRRIFPALLVILAAVNILAWLFLVPSEYWQLAKHTAASAGFVANYTFFLEEIGYFNTQPLTKPLLHLWSLGVEEQFYIVWPLLVWCAWKMRLKFLYVAAAIGVLSFALNVRDCLSGNDAAAFDLIQDRAWQLSLGSTLAALPFVGQKFSFARYSRIEQIRPNLFSAAGIALIALSALLFSDEGPYPGWAGLVPTLGACLTIAAGQRAFLNRTVLSNKIMVWFGLISYPLYLWHWPLLSFAAITGVNSPRTVRISMIIISIALAWLTYHFVEQPTRYRKSRHVTASLFLAMACLGMFSYTMYIERPRWFELSYISEKQGEVGLPALVDYYDKHFFRCSTGLSELDESAYRCIQSRKDRPIKVVIIGDSHAFHLLAGIAEAMPEVNVAFMGRFEFVKESRMPIVETRAFEEIYNYVLNRSNITSVIISAFWQNRLGEIPEGKSLDDAFRPTVMALLEAGKRVYFGTDVPWFSITPEQCKYVRWLGPKPSCKEDRKFFSAGYETWLPLLIAISQNHGVKLLDFAKVFCDKESCHMQKDGVLLYADSHQLNSAGSRLLGKIIVAEHPELAD